MNTDNILSIARSVLKIGGGALVALGLASAGQIDPLVNALMEAVGAIATAAGLFWSFWHHTPDEPAK